MSKGPAAAPTKLKLLKGVSPYRINDKEPKPKSVSGVMPPGWGAHMSDGAKRFWKKYAPVLSNLGVLTEADLPAFQVLCSLRARWIRVEGLMRKYEKDPKLGLSYIRAANLVETQMLRYMQEFGMTPSGRGKIVVVGQNDDDEDRGFLD
ncbi:unnamed protein product [marine sediment metagenome]|uniref:Phage terminase small subunit P27 family n=1 Tax=marine sediment metagenome TaxID=412755 RepID=X0YCE7_9ZZZZ